MALKINSTIRESVLGWLEEKKQELNAEKKNWVVIINYFKGSIEKHDNRLRSWFK
jgi:hypothetical protein